MNEYESIVIIDPSLEEKAIKELIAKFTDLINSDGKIENVDEMGLRKLAYEVQKKSEGYYVVYYFEANPQLIAELERVYRITDGIMKFITIRRD